MRAPFKYLLSVVMFALFSIVSGSQNRTSYFVADSPDRHNMNASFAPQQGYIGVPFLSNVNIVTNTNLGVSNFMFPSQDGPVLFMNKTVTSDQFLTSLGNRNAFDANVSVDIIDVGWRTKRDFFWTVSLGLRGEADSDIPRDFFSFMKDGCSNIIKNEYVISDITAFANTYSQAVVGFSAPIKNIEGFRIGGKIKLLAQIATAEARISKMNVKMNANEYQLSVSGSGYITDKGITLDVAEDNTVKAVGFDASKMGVTGWGFGLDFGLSYRLSEGTLLDGLLFSASVSDFGMVFNNHKTDLVISNDSFTYSGIHISGLNDHSIDDQFEVIGEQLSRTFSVKVAHTQSAGIKKTFLSANVNAGFGYAFLHDKMTLGLLYSHRFGYYRGIDELTLSYDFSLAKCFNVAVSYSFLNNFKSLGFLLTFVPWSGMNVILGSDYNYLRYSSHGIPMYRATMNVKFGLSIPIQGHRFRH